MSVKVELEHLLDVAQGFGTVPMLLTTDGDGRPRAAATTLSWDGTTAIARAGRRSLTNAAERELVSLVWPAPPGERFALLVDGVARTVAPDPEGTLDESGRPSRGGEVRIEVTGAILHVVSGRH